MSFIKFMSKSHLANKNIALYETESGVKMTLENVVNGDEIAKKEFESLDSAEGWWEDLEGQGIGKLSSAIDEMYEG